MKKIILFLLLVAFNLSAQKITPYYPDVTAQNGYNVLLYGLKGDGSTNDRDALNTLLNTTAPTGSTIYFPPGTYLISSNILVLDKQFNFVGVQSTISTSADVSILTFSSTTTGASKCKFTGLVFDGNDTGTSQRGLNFTDKAGSFQITNCSFSDFGGAGVAVANTDASNNLGGMIVGCKFYSNNVGVNLLTRGEYVNIVGCDFVSNTKGILSIAGNMLVDGCNINYNTTGVEVSDGTNDGHSIISNCNINHNTSYPLNISGTEEYMTISNCHIYQSEISIVQCKGVEFIGGIIDINTITITTCTNTAFNLVKWNNAYANSLSITGTKPVFFRCSGDIPSGVVNNNNGTWVDYSATSTVTGWSSFTNKIIRYTVVGKVCIVSFRLNGTSNATSASFTIPFTNVNVVSRVRGCYAKNNGTALTNGGIVWNDSGSATITIYTDWALTAGWTASGVKDIVGTIEVEIAE